MRAHARVVTRTANTEVVRNALDDSFARVGEYHAVVRASQSAVRGTIQSHG